MPCDCRDGGADGRVPIDPERWAGVVEDGAGDCFGGWLIPAVVVGVEVDIRDGVEACLTGGYDCRFDI